MQVNIEGESLPAPYLSPKQSQAALSETGNQFFITIFTFS